MTQNGSICAEEYVVKRGDSFYLIAHKLGVPLRDLLAANRDIHPARLMVGDVLCIPREEDDRPQGGTTGNNGNAGSGSTAGNGSAGGNNTDNSTSGNQMGNMPSADGNTGNSTPGSNTTGGATGSDSTANGSGPNSNGGTNNGSETVIPSPAPTPVPGLACPVEEQVTIARGETIADIQLQNLLSRNTLQTANPTVDLDTLQAGQTICVPAENIACKLPPTYTLLAGETLESVAMRFNLPLGSLLRVNPCLAPQDFEEGVTVILPR
ncbi:MAG: LysM peptidoglycan-binding domain-containing protein [Clostridia bacterium]|nr:LysM peptidoglycan-binding domain-containing protein [Clostridia bacterium]